MVASSRRSSRDLAAERSGWLGIGSLTSRLSAVNSWLGESAVLERRPLASAAAGALAGIASLAAIPGAPGIPCLLRSATGCPCPLCGATTASRALIHGDLATVIGTNPIVPLAALLIAAALATRRIIRVPNILVLGTLAASWVYELHRFQII